MSHRSLLIVSLAVLPQPILAQCATEKFLPPSIAANGFFGSYVDLVGDLGAVSFRSSTGERQAHLFQRTLTGWVAGPVLATGAVAGGSYSTPMRMDGNHVFVGAFEQASEAGRVHVFEEVGGVWSATQVLAASSFSGMAHFGRRMSIDGDQAVVAAPMDATFEYRGGAVFLFEKTAGTWQEVQRIDPPVTRSFGFFGLAVDIEGDTLVVGEPGLQTNGSAPGNVFVYERVQGTWTLVQEFYGDFPHRAFGYALDVEGDRMVVGAFKELVPDHRRGVVHLYERTAGVWSPTGRLATDVPNGNDLQLDSFGVQLEYEPPYLAVGSSAPELGLGSGVHVYRETAAGFELQRVIAPTGSVSPSGPFGFMFGASLALDGDSLLVGSPGDADALGAAYHYELAPLATSYCSPAVANSTGMPGVLGTTGCGTLLEDDLVLRAEQLPTDRPVLFLVGPSTASIPMFAGGQGTLCLGSPLGRFANAITSSGALGTATLSIGLTSLPSPSGLVAAQPGETWNFQAWYRDVNPGATSNLTDAVQVLVQ